MVRHDRSKITLMARYTLPVDRIVFTMARDTVETRRNSFINNNRIGEDIVKYLLLDGSVNSWEYKKENIEIYDRNVE